jgi:hypothetical protein
MEQIVGCDYESQSGHKQQGLTFEKEKKLDFLSITK